MQTSRMIPFGKILPHVGTKVQGSKGRGGCREASQQLSRVECLVMRSHLKSWCHRFATIALIKQRRERYRGRRERRDMACVCEMRSGTALVVGQESHAREVC